MKLRSLATLVFRLLGALSIIDGFGLTISAIVDRRGATEICENIGMLILGYCFIQYSKKLAALFCRGLEDDSA